MRQWRQIVTFSRNYWPKNKLKKRKAQVKCSLSARRTGSSRQMNSLWSLSRASLTPMCKALLKKTKKWPKIRRKPLSPNTLTRPPMFKAWMAKNFISTLKGTLLKRVMLVSKNSFKSNKKPIKKLTEFEICVLGSCQSGKNCSRNSTVTSTRLLRKKRELYSKSTVKSTIESLLSRNSTRSWMNKCTKRDHFPLSQKAYQDLAKK